MISSFQNCKYIFCSFKSEGTRTILVTGNIDRFFTKFGSQRGAEVVVSVRVLVQAGQISRPILTGVGKFPGREREGKNSRKFPENRAPIHPWSFVQLWLMKRAIMLILLTRSCACYACVHVCRACLWGTVYKLGSTFCPPNL